MASCNRCGRALPSSEATCVECDTSPSDPRQARTTPGGWSAEGPRLVAVPGGGATRARAHDPVPSPTAGPAALAAKRLPEQHDPPADQSSPSRPGPVRPVLLGQVVAIRTEAPVPGPQVTSPPAEGREGSHLDATAPPQPARAAPRPPMLASDRLREELHPTEAGSAALRVVAVAAGVVGGAGAAVIGGTSPLVLSTVAILAVIAILGVARLGYGARAWVLLLLSLGGLMVVLVGSAGGAMPPVLTAATAILGAGLLHRGRYRASTASRWLVAVGLLLAATWYAAVGAAEGLSAVEGGALQIAAATVRVAFPLLLVLSLLAFMDSSTTGGCKVWGSAVLAWYPMFAVVELVGRLDPSWKPLPPLAPALARVWPALAGPWQAALTAEMAALTIAGTALVVLTALSLSAALAARDGAAAAAADSSHF